MAIPTNLTAATAIDLGTLPATITQDVYDIGTATAYTVWYKYTPRAGDLVLGAFPYGDATVYRPRMEVYQDAVDTPILQGTVSINTPVQFPVEVGVFDAYYFKFVAVNPAATPAVLTFGLRRAPTDAARRGDICVIDDGPTRPAAILSPTTDYQVRRFVSGWLPDSDSGPNTPSRGFPAGEAGDSLPGGTMLIPNNVSGGTLYCFDRAFTAIATLTSIAAGQVRSNRGANNFYVATGTSVRVVSAQGVLSPAVHAMAIGGPLAANAAETLLYETDSAPSPIRRWNLLTDLALSNLAAAVTTYKTDDLLVLADDSILAIYFNTNPPYDVFIRNYSPAGAILHSYTLGPSANQAGFAHLAYALDDASFWVWTHLIGGDGISSIGSVFQNIRVSDGAILTTVHQAEFEFGSATEPETSAPVARFGCSFSCPFFILGQDEAPVTPLPAACPAPTPSPPSSLPSTGAAPVFP